MNACLDIDLHNPADDLVATCLAAIAAAAERCRQRGDIARAIADLDLSAMLPILDPAAARQVIFEAGVSFGTVDLAQAWHALVPAVAPAPAARVAFGSSRHGWVLVEPIAMTGPVRLLNPDTRSASNAESDGAAAPLLGFPAGAVRRWPAAAGGTGEPLCWDTAARFNAAHAVLLLGLITGGARVAVTTAFAYARSREVGGSPIAQYQAVALRLADLAINGRALDVYAAALAIDSDDPDDPDHQLSPAASATVADFAFRIGRDAVQTAGGHGYVSGLPMRPLFEQLRALTGLLQTIVEAHVALDRLAPTVAA